MPIQILMPALSPTMEEGNLVKWLKKEGDSVKAGQVIAEIETDKATMEVEAVEDGKILRFLVPAGTPGVKVNAPIAILAEEGEESMTAEEAMKKLGTAAPAGASLSKNLPAESGATQERRSDSPPLAGGVRGGGASTSAAISSARLIASPLAKRIADQAGVDLRQIAGTGPNGRIVRADVESFIVSGAKRAPSATMAPPSSAAYQSIPHTGMRKIIAKRLTESKQQVPHFYLTIDCEIDALLTLRKGVNLAKDSKVSVNDCVIRAVALALQKVPAANASWTEDAILQYAHSDVSVAVATPGGLITPIVRQAENKSLVQISAEMRDLATRARDGKLRPDEYQGGGFTISNLGMYGVREFAAIINPPQACILAVGAGEPRAVVKNGQLAAATVMSCTLSTDHRAVDGVVGAEFLTAFKELIENPVGLVV